MGKAGNVLTLLMYLVLAVKGLKSNKNAALLLNIWYVLGLYPNQSLDILPEIFGCRPSQMLL